MSGAGAVECPPCGKSKMTLDFLERRTAFCQSDGLSKARCEKGVRNVYQISLPDERRINV